MATPKKPSRDKSASETSSWIGPAVLILGGILMIALVTWQMRALNASREEEKAAAAAARQTQPALRGYPAPTAAYPWDRLREGVPGEAEVLARESCEWLLAWAHESPPVAAQLFIFERGTGAEHAWKRAPAGAPVAQLGFASTAADDGSWLWFRRGRFLARLAPRSPSPEARQQVESVAHDLDMAIVRTYGADPS